MNNPNDEFAVHLGNRHLGPDTGGKLLPAKPRQRHSVRVRACQDVAETVSGQQTLWLLTNLLARQFGVIQELCIDVPRVPLLEDVALFGANQDLASTLHQTASLIAEPTLDVHLDRATDHLDAEVLVGRELGRKDASFQTCVLGSGWNVYAGKAEHAPRIVPGSGCPFGPYFAACLGAGEVFKWLRGLRTGAGRFIDSLMLSLWDYADYNDWRELAPGEWSTRVVLPPAYLIGAGAVGQALVASLATATSIEGHLTIIDAEPVDDGGNLNRYVLTKLADRGNPKTDIVAEYLGRHCLDAYAYDGKWPDYAYDGNRLSQRPDLLRLEREYRYELVLSCVDKNPARHAIQNFWPKYIMGGSTLDLGLAVAAYDMQSEYECLKCHNPLPSERKSIEETARQLARQSTEARREWARTVGANIEAVEQYLASPQCGTLGEQEIAKFSNLPDSTDWSVGFMSAAAGILLASQFVKYSFLGPATFPTEKGNTLRFSFLNPGPAWSKHRRRAGCQCQDEGRLNYKSLWGEH